VLDGLFVEEEVGEEYLKAKKSSLNSIDNGELEGEVAVVVLRECYIE
jgi:hypothetical protein